MQHLRRIRQTSCPLFKEEYGDMKAHDFLKNDILVSALLDDAELVDTFRLLHPTTSAFSFFAPPRPIPLPPPHTASPAAPPLASPGPTAGPSTPRVPPTPPPPPFPPPPPPLRFTYRPHLHLQKSLQPSHVFLILFHPGLSFRPW
ncbi:unnamed protein product [Closterium sp. NIES-54]